MSYQKPSTSSGFNSGIAPTSRFQNKNLNNAIAKTSASKDKASGNTVVRGSFAVIQGKSRFGKTVGAAAAPTPLNTPSLKRENNGKDVSIALVPVGGSSVWGSNAENGQTVSAVPAQSEVAPVVPAPVVAKPAPWAKAAGDVTSASAAPKLKPSGPAKSWADAESDDDDEADTPGAGTVHAQSAPAYTAAPTYQPLSMQREVQRNDHHGGGGGGAYGGRGGGAGGGRPSHGGFQQRERGMSGGDYSQRGRSGSHSERHYHQSVPLSGSEMDREQQRAIEASRQELEALEARKARHYEQQQLQLAALQQQLADYEQQQLQQQQLQRNSRERPQGAAGLFGNSFGHQQQQPQNASLFQQSPPGRPQYSGSGLLNSSNDQIVPPRSEADEAPTWERAKKPIAAPAGAIGSRAIDRASVGPARLPPPPVASPPQVHQSAVGGNHFSYSYNGFQQQQQQQAPAVAVATHGQFNPFGGVHHQQQQQYGAGPPHSNQYPQVLRNRSRGPSDDLTASTLRVQQQQQQINLSRQQQQQQQEAQRPQQSAAVVSSKSFASLFPKPPASQEEEPAAEAEDSQAAPAEDAAESSQQQDREIGRRQSGEGPRRRMLYEPKSGQFVDPAVAAAAESAAHGAPKHENSKAADAAKWARATRKPSADAVDESINAVGGPAQKKYAPTAVLTRARPPAGGDSPADAVAKSHSAVDSAAAAAAHEAAVQAKIAERTRERESRGPRTEGLLFRVSEAEQTAERAARREVARAGGKRGDRDRRDQQKSAVEAEAAISSELENKLKVAALFTEPAKLPVPAANTPVTDGSGKDRERREKRGPPKERKGPPPRREGPPEPRTDSAPNRRKSDEASWRGTGAVKAADAAAQSVEDAITAALLSCSKGGKGGKRAPKQRHEDSAAAEKSLDSSIAADLASGKDTGFEPFGGIASTATGGAAALREKYTVPDKKAGRDGGGRGGRGGRGRDGGDSARGGRSGRGRGKGDGEAADEPRDAPATASAEAAPGFSSRKRGSRGSGGRGSRDADTREPRESRSSGRGEGRARGPPAERPASAAPAV